MKLKLWLYVGYFIVFTFVFSQIAFPLSATVEAVNAVEAASSESLPVFNMLASNEAYGQEAAHEFLIQDAILKEAEDYHFLEYEVNVESTSLLPLDILDSKLTIGNKYKDRIIIRVVEPYDKVVSTMKPASKKFMLLADTSFMTEEEIHDMIASITIHLSWKALGWKRETRVFLPENTLAI